MPADGYKYKLRPIRVRFASGSHLSSFKGTCCGRLHYCDLDMELMFRNRTLVRAVFTHVAIARLLELEADSYFSQLSDNTTRASVVRLKEEKFEKIRNHQYPVLLAMSVKREIIVSAVTFQE